MPSTGAIDRSGSRPGTAKGRASRDVERQRRIVDLLSRAVALEGDARRRFLDRTCAGDRELCAEIESMLRQALEMREATLGGDHPDVAESLHELGLIAGRAGRRDEARRLLERAHDIRRQTLPADHPELARTRSALAAVAEP